MSKEVRVRFAPSPTGYLHVGGARTAFYNYMYAKKNGGKFILRVEDTDLERSTKESLDMQLNDLKWLGLNWDEGPYFQSERLDIYKDHCNQLLEKGLAYYDFRTDEELEKARQGEDGHYTRIQRPTELPTLEEARTRIEKGEPAAVRFKVDTKEDFVVNDLVRGEVKLPADMVGDFVIMRSNGMPVYNFCCAIDDALMNITHVLRAEEHLSNTLRQKMIYQAFGYDTPQFGHMSLILGKDKQKLSKRHGATSCHEYKVNGYLPEALLNFIALLGWSSPEGKEIMSVQEMTDQFSVDRLHVAGAVFDEEKLKWMNATHLRDLPHGDLWNRLTPLFEMEKLDLPQDKEWIDKALTIFKTKMETLNDAVPLFWPIDMKNFKITDEGKEVLGWETTPKVLETWKGLVSDHNGTYLTGDDFQKIQNSVKENCGVKGKQLFMPIRVAVIGQPHGADLQSLVPLLTRDSLLERVEKCQSS